MTQIHVMFSSRPKLLSEVLGNLINSQPDMEVVGEVVAPLDLIYALREIPVDVIIISPSRSDSNLRIFDHLLKEHPQLVILALTVDNKQVYVYQSGSPRKCVENPSEQALLTVIRDSISINQ